MAQFDIDELWKRWVPEIEALDTRIIWCRICKDQLAMPFSDRCATCDQKHTEEDEKRIQRKRKYTGFTDFCIDCHSYERVWVASYDRYEIERGPLTYRIVRSGRMTCALCESCIERILVAPVYRSKTRVVWGRNIHYIRKAFSFSQTSVGKEAESILKELNFS